MSVFVLPTLYVLVPADRRAPEPDLTMEAE